MHSSTSNESIHSLEDGKKKIFYSTRSAFRRNRNLLLRILRKSSSIYTHRPCTLTLYQSWPSTPSQTALGSIRFTCSCRASNAPERAIQHTLAESRDCAEEDEGSGPWLGRSSGSEYILNSQRTLSDVFLVCIPTATSGFGRQVLQTRQYRPFESATSVSVSTFACWPRWEDAH